GPHGNGTAEDGADPPIEFGPNRNVVWRAAVPGRGHSSPIVLADRVVLTTADERRQTQSVLCFDRDSGRLLWQTPINRGGFGKKHPKNTYATPTPTSDGKTVYAVFWNHDQVQLAALSLDGKVLWKRYVGPYVPIKYKFGYAPSPLLYDETIIIASEFENGAYLIAVDKRTGRTVWKTPRPSQISFSSPIVGRVAGRDQLLISGAYRVASYDPRSGRLLWSVKGTTAATCGTMVWDGNLVFASGGYPDSQTIAVHADGSRRIAWQNNRKAYEQSLLAVDGFVYAVTDRGIAYCWDAETGQTRWMERLGGLYSSSPTFAAGRIYVSNEAGTTFVLAADPNAARVLARTQLGNEVFASPAICDDRIFYRVAVNENGRRQELLYCFGRTARSE
ncbi:MAG: dehydrogenase, partial [Planctomycetota bacterium]